MGAYWLRGDAQSALHLGSWIKSDLLPRSNGDYRLGADIFTKKLAYDEMVDTPLDKLLEIGDANLKKKLDEAKLQWSEVYDLAKRGGISNKWSRRALENLGREFPGEYTPLRQEIIQGTDAP